eukprot:gb/GECH01009339.1/.p1 GENE.gb/GECH01009339.1/~~gb/GECH01009339.1/.p1  ORF type:complete len:943 (+),score=281.54 gb/GECH01009339.1/:1-2829(+)
MARDIRAFFSVQKKPEEERTTQTKTEKNDNNSSSTRSENIKQSSSSSSSRGKKRKREDITDPTSPSPEKSSPNSKRRKTTKKEESSKASETSSKPTKTTKTTKKQKTQSSPSKSTQKSPKTSKSKNKTPEKSKETSEKRKWNPRFQRDDNPPNHGNKARPEGDELCLQGLSFVITGTLDSLYRNEAEDFIQKHGGVIRKSISGRTSYVVAGSDPGPSKMESAKKHKTKVVDEDALFDLVKSKSKNLKIINPDGSVQGEDKGDSQGSQSEHKEGDINPDEDHDIQDMLDIIDQEEKEKEKKEQEQQVQPMKVEEDSKPSVPQPSLSLSSSSSSFAMPSKTSTPAAAHRMTDTDTMLWTDKYAPKTIKDLVGNTQNIQQLMNWLRDWKTVHLHHQDQDSQSSSQDSSQGSSKSKGRGKSKPTSDAGKKAVLVSGPPGIGKSSAIRVVCNALEFEVFELNASDSRSKKTLRDLIGSAVDNQSISQYFAANIFKKNNPGKNVVLVMDEVDGVGGGDRGGIPQLIQTIKTSKIPVVCICNDRFSQKLKSLVNYCIDLRFARPTKVQIAKKLARICKNEGMSINDNALQLMATELNNDIRNCLNSLQMWSLKHRSFSYDNVKRKVTQEGFKNKDMGLFDAAGQFLRAAPGNPPPSYSFLSDMYFSNMDLIPLFVQENYLNYAKPGTSDVQQLHNAAEAAESISASDLVSIKIRKHQQWHLLPQHAALSSIIPSSYIRGHMVRRSGRSFYGNPIEFPKWLGKNSNRSKNLRLTKAVHLASRKTATGTSTDMITDYFPVLRHAVADPLLLSGKDGIPDSIHVMDEYGLTRDDIDTIAEVGCFEKKTLFATVPTTVKSALTRSWNQSHLASATTSVKQSKTPTTEDITGPEETEDEDDEDSQDPQAALQKDALFQQKKKKKKATSKKSSKSGTSSKSKSKSTSKTKSKKGK